MTVLSAREREILDRYIQTGETIKETARQLGLSHKTVDTHWDSIRRKLGVNDRQQLLVRSSAPLVIVDPKAPIVLVAECPGPSTPEGRAIPLFPVPETSAGARLIDILDITRPEYFRLFRRVNLFPQHQSTWSPLLARQAAENLRSLLEGRRVVFLGKRVRRAFGLREDAPLCEWRRMPPIHTIGEFWFALVPHPSGRNPWYNELDNRLRVRECLLKTTT